MNANRTNILLPSLVLLIIVSVQMAELLQTRASNTRITRSEGSDEAVTETTNINTETTAQTPEREIVKASTQKPQGSHFDKTKRKFQQSLRLEKPTVLKSKVQEMEHKSEEIAQEETSEKLKFESAKSNQYKTCFGLLHEGGWRESVPDFEVEANSTLQVTMAGNASLAWTGPPSCEYKIYEPASLKKCLSTHFPRVQIVGDSRARQYWAALKPLLDDNVEENFVMFDSAWQMPTENVLKVNSTGLKVDQAWVKKYGALQKAMRIRYARRGASGFMPDEEKVPDLIVMTAMILHPVTMSGIERDETWNNTLTNTTYMADEAKRANLQMRTSVLDELRLWGEYATILVLEAEPISPEVYPLDRERNQHVRAHNELLRELIPEGGLDGKIFRISVNTKVVQHPNQKFMLPDRFHLQKKDKPRVTPPTLLTNINVMANFLCNRHQEQAVESKLCCKRGLDAYV